ncbi:MAG: hypothetical protein V4754_06265 [Pseudomonadota bacterium]
MMASYFQRCAAALALLCAAAGPAAARGAPNPPNPPDTPGAPDRPGAGGVSAAVAPAPAPAGAEGGAKPMPTTSVAEADARLAEVARLRAVVEAEYADSERHCNSEFFVNHCLEQAKEKRRIALARLRLVEVEASHFKRAESVARRDQSLAEQQRQDAQVAAERQANPPKPKIAPSEPAIRKPVGKSVAEREAEHAAKMQGEAAQEAAGAGKRAANVAAFERKQRETAKRQREVVAKQAARAEKVRKEAESRAAEAAAEAARVAAAAKQR